MEDRHLRRRAFWIGFRSIWDLSGQRTRADLRRLADESRAERERTAEIAHTYGSAGWTYRYTPERETYIRRQR